MRRRATLGTGLDPPGPDGRHAGSAAIDGEPAAVGDGVHRARPRGLADAGDGPAVHRRRRRPPPLPRPPRTGGRCRPRRAGSRPWSGRCARATGCWRRRDATAWLDAVEHEIAELGVAVAAAARARRSTACRRLADARTIPAPSRRVDRARRLTSSDCCSVARRSRSRTATARCCATAAPATRRRPHARRARTAPISWSRHPPKDVPAGDASTGEQKALLIGLVLAHARLMAEMTRLRAAAAARRGRGASRSDAPPARLYSTPSTRSARRSG